MQCKNCYFPISSQVTEITHNIAVLRPLWPALNTWNQVLATGHTDERFIDVSSTITVLSSGRMNKGIIWEPKRSLLSFTGFITSFHI
jgi:hypothetical protein